MEKSNQDMYSNTILYQASSKTTVKLVDDVIYNILFFLAGPPNTRSSSALRSWTLVNKFWFRIATPLLWRNPFLDVFSQDPVSKCISLLSAYIRSLPEDEKPDIDLRTISKPSIVNYAQYITVLNEHDLRKLIIMSGRVRRGDVDAMIGQLFQFFLRSSLVLKTLTFKYFIPERNLPKTIQNLELTYTSDRREELCRLMSIQESLVELTLERWSCNLFKFLDKLPNLKNTLVSLNLVDFKLDKTEETKDYLKNIRKHFPKLQQLSFKRYDSELFFRLHLELEGSMTFKERNCGVIKWVTEVNV
jgi:hypothetical protein